MDKFGGGLNTQGLIIGEKKISVSTSARLIINIAEIFVSTIFLEINFKRLP